VMCPIAELRENKLYLHHFLRKIIRVATHNLSPNGKS
jgi:hypothetical protein